MSITELLNKIVDWFVPEEFFEDKDLLLRTRVLVAVAPLTVIWLIFVFRLGPLSVLFGAVLSLFVLVMPFFLKRTGSVFWSGNALLMIMTLSNFYRCYWDGGFSANILWWHVVPPVTAVMILGTWHGGFWGVVNAASVGLFIYFESTGYDLPGRREITDLEVFGYTFLLMFILTVVTLYLELSKNVAMSFRESEVRRSKTFETDMKRIAQKIKSDTETINSSSNALTKTLHSMRISTEEISQVGAESATAINQSTSTIQELASSLDQTVGKMKELVTKAQSIEEIGNQGAENVKLSARAMAKINEGRQEYDTILQAITDIADSAHLLSLNAAIEAAKAGDFGKGFFVVVEEIRDLAKRSNDAVVEIRKVMKQGGFVILRGKSVIGSLAEVFQTISQLVANITRQLDDIVVAIEEQDIGIKEIAQGTDEIAHASEENTVLVEELQRSIEDNSKTVENLHQIAEQLESKIVKIGTEIN